MIDEEEEQIPLESLIIVELQELIEDVIERIGTAENVAELKLYRKKYRELASIYNNKIGFEAYKSTM